MDDFIPNNLKETTNEWVQRLISIITPLIYDGIQSIFNEAYGICQLNRETNKYLMTFQNCIRRIPKYNQTVLETERNRMIQASGCNYLEDLITCVHISVLKSLTCIRVGNRQKKIDLSIPKLDVFIHKVYINVGRKVYLNTDLFIVDVPLHQKQKNRRELEYIIEKCILTTIRDSLPYEQILRSYLDETEEHEEEVFEQERADDPPPPPPQPPTDDDKKDEFKSATVKDMNEGKPLITSVSFNPIELTHNTPIIDNSPIQRMLLEETPSPFESQTSINGGGGGGDRWDTSARWGNGGGGGGDDKIKIMGDVVETGGLDFFDLNTDVLPNAMSSSYKPSPSAPAITSSDNFLTDIIELL